jgi:hypothetical protein
MRGEELQREARLRTARRQTLAAAAISLGGNVVGAIISYSMAGWDAGDTFRCAHAALAAAILLFLVLRPQAPMRVVMASFVALIAPVLPLMIVWTLATPEAHVIEPFIAQKMVLVGVALLTPESATLGLVLTGIVVAEAVALSMLRLAGGRAGEPWVTLFYAMFAVGLLLHRASERRLAMQLVRMTAEARALEQIARESLDVRDRLNSPLQTLELGLELLSRSATADDDLSLLARLKSTVERLKALSQRLARGSPTVSDDRDEES